MGDAETARSIRKNKNYITCFPRIGLQLLSDDDQFESELYIEFEPTEKKGNMWDGILGQ